MNDDRTLADQALRLFHAAVVSRWVVAASVWVTCGYLAVGGVLALGAGLPVAAGALWIFALLCAVVQVRRSRRWSADPFRGMLGELSRRNVRGWRLSLGVWLGVPLVVTLIMAGAAAAHGGGDPRVLGLIGATMMVLLVPFFAPSILAAVCHESILRRYDSRHPDVGAALVGAAQRSATLDATFRQAPVLLGDSRAGDLRAS